MKKNFKSEITTLERITVKHANDYYVLNLLGHAHSSSGNRSVAISTFRQAIQVNSSYRPPYDGLLNVLKEQKNYYESRILIEDMIRQFGEEARLFNDLCRMYSNEAFLDKIQEVCSKAVQLDPNYADNHIYLAINYKDQGNAEQALKIAQTAANRFPKSELANFKAGELSENVKNFLAAFKYYQRATIAEKKSSRAHVGSAKMAFELKKYQVSLDEFILSCKIDQKNIQDFKSAESKLKFAGELEWEKKFSEGIGKCYL